MTLRDAIKLLSDANIDSAAYDAREIFSTLGKMKRSELVSTDARCDAPTVVDAIKRRALHEPLQYIIGEVGFFRETYTVTPACLIPRADTELLVEVATKRIPQGESFIDLCTGSGCVAISTLSNTKDTTAIAVDISREALSIAEKNAIRNGVSERLTLLECDVTLGAVKDSCFAVLSNPPYVTEAAYKALMPEIYYEPKIAFVGGEDGLVFYKSIVHSYRDVIKNSGFIAFEIGYDQGDSLREIADAELMDAEILKDLSGHNRVAVLTKR